MIKINPSLCVIILSIIIIILASINIHKKEKYNFIQWVESPTNYLLGGYGEPVEDFNSVPGLQALQNTIFAGQYTENTIPDQFQGVYYGTSTMNL